MPEFYDGADCRYQRAAQPYLAAIARGIRDEPASRAFLLKGTKYERAYEGAEPLWKEQWAKRDPANAMKCPFWSNYWYEPCRSCDCRIDMSVSMEVDALFFLRSAAGETMAIHIEMKRDRESLSMGKPKPIDLARLAFGISAARATVFWLMSTSSRFSFAGLVRTSRW